MKIDALTVRTLLLYATFGCMVWVAISDIREKQQRIAEQNIELERIQRETAEVFAEGCKRIGGRVVPATASHGEVCVPINGERQL